MAWNTGTIALAARCPPNMPLNELATTTSELMRRGERSNLAAKYDDSPPSGGFRYPAIASARSQSLASVCVESAQLSQKLGRWNSQHALEIERPRLKPRHFNANLEL